MNLSDGVYRLIGGNGWTFCIKVQSGWIYPLDPGGDVIAAIRVLDRTFGMSRGDLPMRIHENGIEHEGKRYLFEIEAA